MKPSMNLISATVEETTDGVPRPGQLIADRYKLERLLERGAMGSVWRAEQIRLRAPVAVKFLDPSLIGDREMHDRFIQEARSAAAVRSAHVVQVFDYGTEEGVPYIVMELLEGENLDTRLCARGLLTPAELAKLFSEVARGIGQAHAIGVIHRDLKPGNIFIAREGEHEVTKIIDFGIAKVRVSALRLTQGVGTQLGTLLGTPQYMSPEQVRGSASIDHRTDLWALGVIACECLTGRCPYSGTTLGDLTVQICTEKPPAPSSLGAVPPGFDQWFFKATHKKPSKRFQNVEEMAERLHAVLAPAILAAPGVARTGRLAFASRSVVRLAYTAVVTWKGHVMDRLSQRWLELRRLLARVVQGLSLERELASQRLRGWLGSERMGGLSNPIIQRHGLLASLALLSGGILLLGLAATADPAPAGPRETATVLLKAPLRAAAHASATPGLAALAATSGAVGTGEVSAAATVAPGTPSLPAPSLPAQDPPASNLAAPNLSGPSLPPANPAVAEAPGSGTAVAAGAPGERLEVLNASREGSAVGKEAPAVPLEKSAPLGDSARQAAVPSRRHAAPASIEGQDAPRRSLAKPGVAAAEVRAPNGAKPAAASDGGAAAKPAVLTKAPITKAMAQAATKILTADELVASIPAKKPTQSPPPRALRPAKPSGPTSPAKSADPFDDRL